LAKEHHLESWIQQQATLLTIERKNFSPGALSCGTGICGSSVTVLIGCGDASSSGHVPLFSCKTIRLFSPVVQTKSILSALVNSVCSPLMASPLCGPTVFIRFGCGGLPTCSNMISSPYGDPSRLCCWGTVTTMSCKAIESIVLALGSLDAERQTMGKDLLDTREELSRMKLRLNEQEELLMVMRMLNPSPGVTELLHEQQSARLQLELKAQEMLVPLMLRRTDPLCWAHDSSFEMGRCDG